MLLIVLHLIPDADDPYGIVATLTRARPSGSYLVLATGQRHPRGKHGRNDQAASVTMPPRTSCHLGNSVIVPLPLRVP